ncbi:hypothetical protein Tco_0127041 [Tanacetum coccineum]
MADHSQKWHNGMSTRTRSTKTFDGLAAIQAQLNNLGREIKKVNERVYAAQVGGRYRAVAPGFYQRDSENPSYQERRQTMEESLSKNQGASIKALEIQIGKISKVLQVRGSGSLPSYTETNPRDHVKSISTTVEADTPSIRRIKPVRYAEALKSLLMDKPRIGYQIEASMNVHDLAILEDSLPLKEKDQGILLYLVISIIFVLKSLS